MELLYKFVSSLRTDGGGKCWSSFVLQEKLGMVSFWLECWICTVDEFILPALTEESNYLDHSIYHYDGIGALRHLDSVLSI